MDGDMASGREQGDRGFRVFPWQPRGAGGVSLTDVWAHDREVHMSVGVVPCIYRREDSSEELLGHSMQFGDGAMSWGV